MASNSLFRDFSFDVPTHHTTESAVTSVSPRSMSPVQLPARLPTPPPCDINDLMHALRSQDLRVVVNPKFAIANEPLTPPSDEDTFAHALPERPPQLSTARLNSATLRMQRQANVRMQSSSAHIKDISSLVEKMIETEDQCTVSDRKSKHIMPSTTQEDEDEGVDMDFTPTAKEDMRAFLPFYRAADRLDGSARVSKKPRMRKPSSRVIKRASR